MTQLKVRVDSQEFLRIADQVASSSDEAALRTAVGRAYYAAFLVARDKVGLTNERQGVHMKTISALRRRQHRALADQLFQLGRLRIDADYYLVTVPAPGSWSQAWTDARNLANRLIPRLKRI